KSQPIIIIARLLSSELWSLERFQVYSVVWSRHGYLTSQLVCHTSRRQTDCLQEDPSQRAIATADRVSIFRHCRQIIRGSRDCYRRLPLAVELQSESGRSGCDIALADD